MTTHFSHELTKGLWDQNPVLRLLLGLCPTLAVTTSALNGLGMGGCTLMVLLGSNVVISLLRPLIPKQVRIPCFIVVIATFVTIVDLVMAGFAPALHKNLGLFIPLIVVNCIILGRAEAFAFRNGVLPSVIDALGMGIGFTFALFILGSIREILGKGEWLGMMVMMSDFPPILVFVLPPGAFITLGVLLAGMNKIERMRSSS